MRRETIIHSGILAVALIVSAVAAVSHVVRNNWDGSPSAAALIPTSQPALMGVPSRLYQHIVALAGANVLHQLVTVDRIAAIDASTSRNPLTGWCFADTATIANSSDLNSIAALNPDLIIVGNGTEDVAVADHFRRSNVAVLALPEVENFDQFRDLALHMGRLVQADSQAEQWIATADRRVRILTAHATGVSARCIFPADLPRGQQLRVRSAMRLAGLVDARSVESPAVIITVAGSVGLSPNAHMIELPADLLSDPTGYDMIEAATFIATAVEKARIK